MSAIFNDNKTISAYLGSTAVSALFVGTKRIFSNAYNVNGFEPSLAFDFAAENYAVDNTVSSFDAAITHSRSGNATMVDSDGLLKWAPHNLATYSEEFDQWSLLTQGSGVTSVVTANQGDSPIGIATADRVQFSRATSGTGDRSVVRALNVSTKNGALYKFRVWMKSFDGSSYEVVVFNNYAGGGGTVVTVTPEWQLFEYEDTATADSSTSQFIIGLGFVSSSELSADVLLWGAHVYRSDLGGMVDNPDRGDSYVPTTDSAVYLPRRGHHVYNGSEWVNEGLLHESEARTNLVTYSEDFTDASWVYDDCSFSGLTTGPDGASDSASVITVNSDGGASETNLYRNINSVGATTAFSVFVNTASSVNIELRTRFFGSGNGESLFNLSTGAVTKSAAHTDAGMEDLGNGWFRAFIVFDSGVVDSVGHCIIQFAGGSIAQDGASSIVIYGAQVEAGSTPSSYIPTSGSTVTRAADTLTVPSANLPWPEPNVIGEELSPPSSYNNIGTDWTDNGDGSYTYDGTNDDTILRFDNLATNKIYRVNIEAVSGTPDFFGYLFAASPNISEATSFPLVSGLVSDGRFQIQAQGNSAYTINISIREIDPLALSIQMDGRMTYADEGVISNPGFIEWRSGLIGIDIKNRTDSTRVGRVLFRQFTGGVTSVVENLTDVYTPGINVPFNVASRHGSTFINGAVDGTALTENTTPTALPDLSSTDLDLAFKYMGTIKLFRIWSDDLGDTGIAAASEGEPSSYLLWDATADTYIQRIYD